MPRLVSGLGQQLLKVHGSVVANVKKPHQTSFNLAKDGVSIVLRSFGTVRERALHNLSYYGLVSESVILRFDLIWPLTCFELSGI